MTLDKIKHYIGDDLFNFYGSLNAEQLQNCKKRLLQEFNKNIKIPVSILFKYTIEMEYINYLLK